jgi:myosin heavy subunit
MNNMKESPKVQMINISGESGSGKTETNKQCLRIISFVCEHGPKKADEIQSSVIE